LKLQTTFGLTLLRICFLLLLGHSQKNFSSGFYRMSKGAWSNAIYPKRFP